jgi:hypothetical protein
MVDVVDRAEEAAANWSNHKDASQEAALEHDRIGLNRSGIPKSGGF